MGNNSIPLAINKLLVRLFLLFQLIYRSSACDSDDEPCLFKFTVKGQGFHREMEVSSTISTHLSDCKILLKWTVSSGAYVDPYQLHSSIENGTTRFYDLVDVESMAHTSPPLVFYTIPQLICDANGCSLHQSIPVHGRYHPPARAISHAKVELQSPLVFSTCNNLAAPYSDETDTECLWELMPTAQLTEELLVPVGDLSHFAWVSLVTILFTFAGSFSIALAVSKY